MKEKIAEMMASLRGRFPALRGVINALLRALGLATIGGIIATLVPTAQIPVTAATLVVILMDAYFQGITSGSMAATHLVAALGGLSEMAAAR